MCDGSARADRCVCDGPQVVSCIVMTDSDDCVGWRLVFGFGFDSVTD